MRKLAFLALLAALATVPASAQTAPSPYETVTVTESFPGLPDETYQVSCDWYPAEKAVQMVQTGSYQVILTGNHGWSLCN